MFMFVEITVVYIKALHRTLFLSGFVEHQPLYHDEQCDDFICSDSMIAPPYYARVIIVQFPIPWYC